MKVSALPSDYKTVPRFTKPAHIKGDTHYVFTTKKYVAEVIFHGSMFYAPDFYSVAVKDKTGKEIWNGGDAYFLDSLFRADFVSDAFERMILTRVNSTESSAHMQVLLIDLKTGKEEALTEEGSYHGAGHFVSFDGVYYADKNGVHCIDYKTGNCFMLHDVLQKHFTEVKTWSTCAVKDCVLVVSGDNNICLFNLHEHRIVNSAALLVKPADLVSVSMDSNEHEPNIVVSVVYSDRQTSGAFTHRTTEYFNLEF